VSLAHGAVLRELTGINKRDLKAQDLSTALSKIKALLQEIEYNKIKETSANKEVVTTTHAPPHIIEMKEPMGVNPKADVTSDVITMPDRATLKKLKQILDKARSQKEAEATQPKVAADSSEDMDALADKSEQIYGIKWDDLPAKTADSSEDMDSLAANKEDVSEISWRDLAMRLQSERDQLYLQKQRKGDSHVKVPAITHIGDFVPFKDEIQASVEKNLMADLALALHSGISIEDIIRDLTDRANATD